MRRWRAIVAVIALAVVATVGWIVFTFVRTTQGLPDAYAMWWTGDLLIEYLKMHDNEWPDGWDDLRKADARLSQEHPDRRGGLTFDDLAARVEVDWLADPSQLARDASRDDDPPIHVIWTKSGSTVRWSGAEPNQMVSEYLRASRSVATQSSTPTEKPTSALTIHP